MLERYRGGVSSFLEPLNEHLSIVPIAVYRVLVHTAGLSEYVWFRVVLALYDVACGWCVWILARRRVSPSLALGLTAILVFCGAAYENFLFPIQIGQVGSLLGALVAWIMLDGDSRGETAGAIAAVAFALASSAIGAAVLAGVGLEVLLRRQWSRFAGMVALAVLFGAWYLSYAHGKSFFALSRVAAFLGGIAAYTLTGALGLWPLYHLSHGALKAAALLLLVGIVGLCVVASRRGWLSSGSSVHTRPRPTASAPRVLGLITTLAAYWILASLARTGLTPYRSRYMHPGAIILVLLSAELLRGRRLPARTTGVLLAGCAGIVLLGVPYLVHDATKYREESDVLSAQVGALELARAEAPAGFEPAPASDPQVRAGPLFRAEKALGSSPGDPPARIAAGGSAARAAADQVLLRLSPSLVSFATPERACPRAQLRPTTTSGTKFNPHRALLVQNESSGPVKIGLARFSPNPIWLPVGLPAGHAARIETEQDTLSLPWRIYSSPEGSIRICYRPPPNRRQ